MLFPWKANFHSDNRTLSMSPLQKRRGQKHFIDHQEGFLSIKLYPWCVIGGVVLTRIRFLSLEFVSLVELPNSS